MTATKSLNPSLIVRNSEISKPSSKPPYVCLDAQLVEQQGLIQTDLGLFFGMPAKAATRIREAHSPGDLKKRGLWMNNAKKAVALYLFG